MKPQAIILAFLWVVSAHAEQGSLNVCVDYHCERQQKVVLRDIEWQKILAPFDKESDNARQERQQISQSIALFEQYTGLHTGTHADLAENEGDDIRGQLDCISESRNTEHYLQWLEKSDQLRWHSVEQRIKRASFLFDVHWTAVIKDKQSGKQYAVDSWFYKNGEAPNIQPLKQWQNKRPAKNTFIP